LRLGISRLRYLAAGRVSSSCGQLVSLAVYLARLTARNCYLNIGGRLFGARSRRLEWPRPKVRKRVDGPGGTGFPGRTGGQSGLLRCCRHRVALPAGLRVAMYCGLDGQPGADGTETMREHARIQGHPPPRTCRSWRTGCGPQATIPSCCTAAWAPKTAPRPSPGCSRSPAGRPCSSSPSVPTPARASSAPRWTRSSSPPRLLQGQARPIRRTHPAALRRQDHRRSPRLRRRTHRSARLISRQARTRLRQPRLPRPPAAPLHTQRQDSEHGMTEPHGIAYPALDYRICYSHWRG
jgi:hypothetical protein